MRSKNAILNITTNLILQIIVLLYGFIVPKIVISNFGSNVNGLISSITQFLAYISLLESGFGPVVKSILYEPISKKDKKSITNILKTSERFFRNIAYIFLAYIALLCILYPLLVNNSFDLFYTISLIIIIGISTFAEYFFGMTYRLYLQAEQKVYIISIIQIITYVLSVITIVLLVKLGVGIHLIKLISSIIFVFRPILQNTYVKKKYRINLKDADTKIELKQKWDGLSQHIASVIHSNTDITLLSIFVNLVEVSVYSVYYLVVKGVVSILQAFASGIDSVFGDMIAKKEAERLRQRFNMYEVLYNCITTFLFASTMVLITPFVSVYTMDIKDANYIRYTFGILLVISEFINMIRSPYLRLTYAAGHFKETKNGAWIECFSNIIISILLVRKFGIIGVAIGTIFAMTIRTIEFVYHTNKYILNRPIWESTKKILLIIFETILIFLISNKLLIIENISYLNWAINAIFVCLVSTFVIVLFNIIFFKSELMSLLDIIKSLLSKIKEKKHSITT